MTARDFIGITHPVIIGVEVQHRARAVGRIAAAHVAAGCKQTGSGVSGCSVVVTGRRILATRDLIRIAHPVIVGVVVNHITRAIRPISTTYVAAGGEQTRRRVGRGGVVIAGGRILTTRYFVRIAHPVIVGVVVHCGACAIGRTGARFTACRVQARHTAVGRAGIIVARRAVLAPGHFIGIAYAVIVAVVVNNIACTVRRTRACFTSHRKGARSCICGCGGVVARR